MSDLTPPRPDQDAPLGASALLSVRLCQRFKASRAEPAETLQELWSGYGQIRRYRLHPRDSQAPFTVIVKSICPTGRSQHPRGWNTSLSHQRKLRSYEVETHFYQHWARHCDTPNQAHDCKIARCYDVFQTSDHSTHIVLEDLDAAGYAQRADTLSPDQARTCLRWLAHFHSCFLRKEPAHDWTRGLWPTGTYWHLATRPDEWQAMADSALKRHAAVIDQALSQCRYQTLVHGDAKVANFCFSPNRQQVAAVDFQYVGGGCGMKDVVYFLGSCLTEADCEQHCASLLDDYFTCLRAALSNTPHPTAVCPDELEREWRQLFPLAWADFQRFLLGWSPGHKKDNGFSRRMTETALRHLSPQAH